jgi:hypothetical protein
MTRCVHWLCGAVSKVMMTAKLVTIRKFFAQNHLFNLHILNIAVFCLQFKTYRLSKMTFDTAPLRGIGFKSGS